MMYPMRILDFYGEGEKRVAQKEEPSFSEAPLWHQATQEIGSPSAYYLHTFSRRFSDILGSSISAETAIEYLEWI